MGALMPRVLGLRSCYPAGHSSHSMPDSFKQTALIAYSGYLKDRHLTKNLPLFIESQHHKKKSLNSKQDTTRKPKELTPKEIELIEQTTGPENVRKE